MELHNLKKPYPYSVGSENTRDLRANEKAEKDNELFNDNNKYLQQLILVSESTPHKTEDLMRQVIIFQNINITLKKQDKHM